MLIGPGGVGKSSLLNGLMNRKFSRVTESTQGADMYTLRPTRSFWVGSTGGGHWVMITDEDEIKELAQLIQRVHRNKQSEEVSSAEPTSSKIEESEDKFNHPRVKAIIDEIKNAGSKFNPQEYASAQNTESEVYLRVWDCGGQPVFLNLLSAFLTARTLFLLMFDASLDLHNPCLHLTHHEGRASKQLEEMSTLQLMVQWMATIHATLLRKGVLCCTDDEGKIYPRILPVGTHGDDVGVQENKDGILKTLTEMCSNKAFTGHLLKGVIIDNTTAGTGESEDPAFQMIRESAENFAAKDLLAIDTPITWVLFRKVFERYCRGKPVIALDEVKELAKACLIPEDTLTSVLAFYHELSVFFYYDTVPSLAYKIIADPQWLIKQMANILALEGFEIVKNDNLWNLLREKGVLVEPLYNQVLSSQKELKPQDIIDLLEHFLIITRIHTADMHKFSGREYFVPSMLPRISDRNPQPTIDVIQSAPPLHLIFSTGYLPPGFFPRLVTVLSQHQNFTVNFERKLYRNEIKFLYGHHRLLVDEVIATEEKFSVCIQVCRLIPRPRKYPPFPGICQEMLQILWKSFEKVKEEWFQGIDINFAFQCNVCQEKDHFISLEFLTSSEDSESLDLESFDQFLFCQKCVRSVLTPEQIKCWLDTNKDSNAKNDIPSHEILEVAGEIERSGKTAELRNALERSDDSECTSAKLLLDRWQKDMISMGISPRPQLMYHLARMGMKELHTKLLYDELSSDSYELMAKMEIERLKEEIGCLRSSIEAKDQKIKEQRSKLEQLESRPRKRHEVKQHAESRVRHVHSQEAHAELGNKLSTSYVHDTYSPATPTPDPTISKQSLAKACEILRPYSYKWKMFGQGLGFSAHELSSIEAAPAHFSTAPSSCLDAMLWSWQQWAPGDHRGSTDYATLESLRTAVDKAGLGLTARELKSV